MQRHTIILATLLLSFGAFAQDDNIEVKQGKDSTINQNVTLERDFQPVIQDAGKIFSLPTIKEPEQKKNKTVKYTDFSKLLSTDYNVNQLTFADSHFAVRPEPYNGFLRAAIGYPIAALDFYYKMNEMDKVNFDVHLNHLSQWDGFSTHGAGILARTGFGFDVDVLFGNSAFNIGFDADNLASKRYYKGRYWDFDAHIGLHSMPSSAVVYKVQIGYLGFSAQNTNFDSIPTFNDILPSIIDNQLQSIVQFEWASDAHHIGLDALIKDHFYSTQDTTISPINFHSMHFEPYYAYQGNKFDIHVGANLDLSLNKGRLFAASPNVRFEARVVPEWLALYGGAVGNYGLHGLHDDINDNTYVNLYSSVLDTVNTYTIADAFLGLKFRPHHDLLFKIYAHYIYTLDDRYYIADAATHQFAPVYAKSSEWKIGGSMHYHYRDIATLGIDGFYRLHTINSDILTETVDRPTWQAQIDLRVKLDSKKRWTLISENYLIGKRLAYVAENGTLTTHTLKPVIDLNLGLEFAIDRNFAVNLRLNDFIHWGSYKNEILYGYTSQGGNITAGINWTF